MLELGTYTGAGRIADHAADSLPIIEDKETLFSLRTWLQTSLIFSSVRWKFMVAEFSITPKYVIRRLGCKDDLGTFIVNPRRSSRVVNCSTLSDSFLWSSAINSMSSR